MGEKPEPTKTPTFQERVEDVLVDYIAPEGLFTHLVDAADGSKQKILKVRVNLNIEGHTASAEVEKALTDGGFLLAILPPGAFISLALFVAGKNIADSRMKKSRSSQSIRRAGR